MIVSERRTSHPGFEWPRFQRALLTSDSSLAEILAGGWLVALRGMVLLANGFAYSPTAALLGELGITASLVGVLLVVIGCGQIAATGTAYYRLRAAIAFAGALVCVVVWIAYVAEGLDHTAVAWTWIAQVVSEAVISLRALLNRTAERAAAAAEQRPAPPAPGGA